MTKPFDLLLQFSKFGLEHGVCLDDPSSVDAFVVHARSELSRGMSDDVLLHGQRVEGMFESLLISLGEFQLLKAEDGAQVVPSADYQAPDFRIVLKDGAQWLIEVKSVYEKDPAHQERRVFSADYYRRLHSYAEATRAELKLAVYWARWSIWTLVSPERLVNQQGEVVVNLPEAMKLNELATLGDRLIGARPPLRLSLEADQARSSAIADDGTVRFVISRGRVFCGDIEIVSDPEREICWIFMQHGDWPLRGPVPVIADGRLESLDYIWEPAQRLNEGFELIGALSRIFSRYYAEATLKDGAVTQVRAPSRPHWLVPLVSSSQSGAEVLPLWRFIIQPT